MDYNDDDLGFIPEEEIEAQEIENDNDLGFVSEEEFSKQEELDDSPSILESGALGTVQGLTFDFGDELYGGGRAIVDKLLGKEEDFSDLYKQRRDEARERIHEAYETNPTAYNVGDIVVGGVLPAIATGGVSGLAKIGGKTLAKEATKEATEQAVKQGLKETTKAGAKYGALSGAGRSTEEDLLGVAKDTVIGAGTGVVAGKVLGKGLEKGKNILKYVNELPSVQKIKSIYDLAKKGNSIYDADAATKIKNETETLVNDFAKQLQEIRNKAGKGIGKTLEEADERLPGVMDDLSDVQKLIDNFKPYSAEQDKVVKELQRVLDGVKKDVEVEQLVPRRFVEDPVTQAEKQLKKKIDSIQSKSELVGEPSNIIKYGRDTDRDLLTAFDATKGTPITTPIKTGVSTPLKLEKTTEKTMPNEFSTTELNDLYKRLRSLYGTAGDNPAKSMVTQTYKKVQEKIDDSLPDDLLNKFKGYKKTFSDISETDKIFDKNLDLSNIDLDSLAGKELKSKINKFIRGVEASGEKGIRSTEDLEKLQSQILKFLPEEQANKIISEIKDISTRSDLVKGSKTQLEFTRKPLEYLLGTVPTAMKRGADIAAKSSLKEPGLIKKTGNTILNMTKKLNNMSQEQAQNLVFKAQNNPKYEKLVPMLEQLTKPGTKRSAALFSLSQQPAFRQFFEDISPLDLDDYYDSIMGPTEVKTLNVDDEY